MNEYRHHLSGYFFNRDDAQSALTTLVERGLAREGLQIYQTDLATPASAPKVGSNAVLKDVILNGAIGIAVGAGIGALAEVALAVANVTLLVASPLLAPLVMLGWGASIGGLLGATAGAVASAAVDTGRKEGWLSALVRDVIASGQVVLVVRTRTAQETAIARDVIQTAVGDYKDSGATSMLSPRTVRQAMASFFSQRATGRAGPYSYFGVLHGQD